MNTKDLCNRNDLARRQVDDLRRVLAWAQARLSELEQLLDQEERSVTVRDLIPGSDPSGEPLRHRIWNGSKALKHINAS